MKFEKRTGVIMTNNEKINKIVSVLANLNTSSKLQREYSQAIDEFTDSLFKLMTAHTKVIYLIIGGLVIWNVILTAELIIVISKL